MFETPIYIHQFYCFFLGLYFSNASCFCRNISLSSMIFLSLELLNDSVPPIPVFSFGTILTVILIGSICWYGTTVIDDLHMVRSYTSNCVIFNVLWTASVSSSKYQFFEPGDHPVASQPPGLQHFPGWTPHLCLPLWQMDPNLRIMDQVSHSQCHSTPHGIFSLVFYALTFCLAVLTSSQSDCSDAILQAVVLV